MEERLNKVSYKIFLVIVKYLPFIIAVAYFIMMLSGYFGTCLRIIPNLFFLSPVSVLFILSASFVFKFCVWHRLPIYYCILLYLINTLDYYLDFLITNNVALFVYLILTLLFIILGIYFKNKHNKIKNGNTHTQI